MTPDIAAPRQQSYCQTCQHFAEVAHGQGHPHPCSRYRWVGPQHYSPTLTADESACESVSIGIRLTPGSNGGLTLAGPKESLTPELIERLKASKGELLVMLTPLALPPAPPPARTTPTPLADNWTPEDTQLAARVLRLSPDDLPPPPFRRYPWSVVTNAHRFLIWLKRDVAMGARSPRARYGVLRTDMRSILEIAARYAATRNHPPEDPCP